MHGPTGTFWANLTRFSLEGVPPSPRWCHSAALVAANTLLSFGGWNRARPHYRFVTTAHPLHTRSTNNFDTSISEATIRPNPRLGGLPREPLPQRHPPPHPRRRRPGLEPPAHRWRPARAALPDSTGRHCHSTRSLAAIDYHSLQGIDTVILLSLLTFFLELTLSPTPRCHCQASAWPLPLPLPLPGLVDCVRATSRGQRPGGLRVARP
jgi:hypothetical protein